MLYKEYLRTRCKKLPKPAQKIIVRGLTHLKIAMAPMARVRLSLGVRPLSYRWGTDRGLELARYYLEELFLEEFSSDIGGHCLEFMDDRYTVRFGKGNVLRLDVLNKEEGNHNTTIIADLTQNNDIPSDLFDCIICTHVLHVIFDVHRAVEELHRILKPGGVLLVAVPHVSMCDPRWHECWRFTQEGLYSVLATAFRKENITMRAYGNSLTAAGEIRGLTAHEFTKGELNYHDERFAVEICARAVKQNNHEICAQALTKSEMGNQASDTPTSNRDVQ
jgi:SAM-dependent methyltransferase